SIATSTPTIPPSPPQAIPRASASPAATRPPSGSEVTSACGASGVSRGAAAEPGTRRRDATVANGPPKSSPIPVGRDRHCAGSGRDGDRVQGRSRPACLAARAGRPGQARSLRLVLGAAVAGALERGAELARGQAPQLVEREGDLAGPERLRAALA